MGTPPHIASLNSSALGKSASWAYHDLFVLRQHDQERKSASEYKGMESHDPLIDFSNTRRMKGISCSRICCCISILGRTTCRMPAMCRIRLCIRVEALSCLCRTAGPRGMRRGRVRRESRSTRRSQGRGVMSSILGRGMITMLRLS
jgi:Copper amine oxidase, enzyme domain